MKMKILSKAAIGIVASLFISQVFADPTSSRNTLQYNLYGYAIHTITTNPVQAYQPVYAWRTHTNFDGSAGIHTQNGKLIGETNAQGILNIVVQSLPHDGIHCGFFINERVSVGSLTSVKSNSLSFTIRDVSPHVGPMHPDIGCGGPFNGDRR
jgi:hypothetical protein